MEGEETAMRRFGVLLASAAQIRRPSLILVGFEKLARFFDSDIFQVPMQLLPS
jgi:hypothetical protein